MRTMAGGTSRTAERPESAAERRARLIGVARDVIADEGVAACTFRRLAQAAGCSTRPFTHAFGTRDGLLREVALQTWEASPFDRSPLADPARLPPDWDCVAELVAIGETFLPVTDDLHRSERVYIEIILFSLTRPALAAELLAFSRAANHRVTQLIDEGRRRGQVTSTQATGDLTMAFWSLQEGIALTALYEPTELRRDRIAPIWRAGVEALMRP
ncbi:MAG: TetR/AcrR family transcriptional regulator [Actinobacteria bacterium]|nr:TetR/AcrR family transcriptional regulator [Actinomycetota bacterium]